MANCLYLHDSYITKFDFMNYAFAKLVVACHFSIDNPICCVAHLNHLWEISEVIQKALQHIYFQAKIKPRGRA